MRLDRVARFIEKRESRHHANGCKLCAAD